MSHRAFRPTVDRLETLCLLDGSSPTMADPANDPAIVALNAEVATAMQNADSGLIGVNVPGMSMTDKDAEIKTINDVRAGFNAKVDQRLADDAITIEALNVALADVNSLVADLTVKAAAGGRVDYIINEIPIALKIGTDIANNITNIQTEDAAWVKFRADVNRGLDLLILDIRGTAFVYNDVVIATYYTSDPFSA